MANTKHHHHCCCCDDHVKPRVEQITLQDGRRAERHTSNDEMGNEIVEVFAEEKRPLKLEERLVREKEEVVSRETVEHVRDGEVTYQEVRSLTPDVPMEVRSRVGVADHHKVVDGDYVRKEDVAKLVSDGVVAGVSAMMDEQYAPTDTGSKDPIFSAQSQVAHHVEEKEKKDQLINFVIGGVVIAQLVAVYMFFVM